MKKIHLSEVWALSRKVTYKKLVEVISLRLNGYLQYNIENLEKRLYLGIIETTRTIQQNRAIRLYWKLLSETLNKEGCTYLSKRGKQLLFTPYKIESDWREMMQEMYGIVSTKDLTTEMINKIYDCMNLDYSLEYGVFQEFPSWQGFLNKIDSKNYDKL